MKRIALFAPVLLAASCFAQQAAPAATSDASPPAPQSYAAPAPGHPLDPADVAVLTGKASPAYAAPFTYAAPPIYLNGADRYYGDWASGPFIRSQSSLFAGPGSGTSFRFSFRHRRAPFFFGGRPFLFGLGRPFRGFRFH